MKLFLFLTFLAMLGACQTAPPPEDPREVIRAEISQSHEELKEEITRTIRNEIMPELREIQLGSKKLGYKSRKAANKKLLKKILIGRVEWISTVAPSVDLRARVDTGAQTCSLHAEKVVEKKVDGVLHVEFTTLDEAGKPFRFLKKVVDMSRVKSTSGAVENRYVIRMKLLFGDRELDVNVNLNNRKHLRHRFLVGRNLLLGDYIVDVSQSRLLGDRQ